MLEKPEKKLGQNSRSKFFLDFEAYYIVSAPAGPENGPKPPKNPKKRVLVITLARGGVTGRSTPPFPCTMGVPDRFRRVRDPNGTILTTFGLPAGPAGPGPKVFSVGGPGGPNIFSPRNFFVQKRYSLGPEWVSGPKKTHFGPL